MPPKVHIKPHYAKIRLLTLMLPPNSTTNYYKWTEANINLQYENALTARNYQGDINDFRKVREWIETNNIKYPLIKPLPPKTLIEHIKYPVSEEYDEWITQYIEQKDKELQKEQAKNQHLEELMRDLKRRNEELELLLAYQEENDKLAQSIINYENNIIEYVNNHTHKEFEDYNEWKDFEQEDQIELVNELYNEFSNHITEHVLWLNDLNTNSRALMMNKLIEFFETEQLTQLSNNKDYIFCFHLRGEGPNQWHSKVLSNDIRLSVINNLKQGDISFMDTWGDENNHDPSDQPDWDIPNFSFIDGFYIHKLSNKKENKKLRNKRGGNFFNYLIHDVPDILIDYLKRLQIFDKLIINNEVRTELNDACVVYAFGISGIPESVLNKMRCVINSRFLSSNKLNTICEDNDIHCVVHYIDEYTEGKNKKRFLEHNNKPYLGVSPEHATYQIELNCYEEHYFIEEQTPFSKYFIEHLDNTPSDKFNQEVRTDRGTYRLGRTFIKSGDLVRTLFKLGKFRPIKYGEYGSLKTTFYNDLTDFNYNLEYEDSQTRLIKKKAKKNFNVSAIFYADFESDPTKKPHVPFMCCVINSKKDIKQTFKGIDCAKQFLNYLPDKSLIYFHNLAYDLDMFSQHNIISVLKKGGRVITATVEFDNKILTFKDSNAIFNCKLKELPEQFGLESGKKELFPYRYYTIERLESNIGIINEAGINDDWNDKDYEEFIKNINDIGCRLSDNTFDMYKYAEFYCLQDVNILKQAFNKFAKNMALEFNINVFDELTISGIAYHLFRDNVFVKNGNLYELSGHIQHFIRKSVHGGRCMTAYNKKWHTKINLCDFDAVSLYPSAISRLYTVEGKPKVIQPNQLNMEFLRKQSAYVVEICITRIDKHYPFPLIVYKDVNLNINDDTKTPIVTTVNDIELEDLIKYQHIEFDLIRGYYWDGKKDYRIQDFIKMLFNKRLEYKKQHNPLQQLFKLIMNSCYGKTIQKPVKYNLQFVSNDIFDEYYRKHYYKVVETYSMEGNKHCFKLLHEIDKQFSFTLLGSHILSMSKRIMNEVMCLAYDLSIKIFYQDTDSMHIEKDKLDLLASKFKEQYGRELIGSQLGQFHSDFNPINNHKETPYAIESYFVAKKIYIDKLTDSSKEIDYHIRGKGLTQNSIKDLAKFDYDNDLMELYKDLYEGKELKFDLLAGQPAFKMNNNFTVESLPYFKRTIKCNLPDGDINNYFH